MSSESERAVLGTLIFKPNYLDSVDIDESLFSTPLNKKVFSLISTIWETDRPEEIPLAVLNDRLMDGTRSDYVGNLTTGLQSYSLDRFTQCVNEVRRAKELRLIAAALDKELRLEVKTGNPDHEAWERIFRKIDALRTIESKGSDPVLRRLSEIDPQPILWAWPNRIPRGKLSLIVGDPGLGKSFLCVDLAARISTGRMWPDLSERSAIGSVLLLPAEDGLADTVVVRAAAAGADLSKLIVLEGITKKGEARTFNLGKDLPILERVIKDTPDLSAIFIDPISAYLGDLDSHKNAEVRGLLAPLSALAERANVSIIGVSHLNKSTASEKAVYRVMGSLSFVAAARACWGVIIDPEDPDQERRLLVPVKTNLSVKPTSLGFRIIDGRLEYESQPVRIDANEAFSSKREDREQRSVAESWLREILQAGPQDVKDIMKQAKSEGVPGSTLYKVCDRLGVIKRRQGFGQFKNSTWELGMREAQ